jgi:hypothetical protein
MFVNQKCVVMVVLVCVRERLRNECGGGVCLELVEKVNKWTHGRRTHGRRTHGGRTEDSAFP